MKRLRNILNIIFWTFIGTYLFLSILLHIPAVQRMTGRCVAGILCEKFGTKVTVGNVNLGFFNRLIIDDFNMLDKANKPMFHTARLSVSVDLLGLTEGKISISSAQVFGLKANIYKKDKLSQTNCQFVIDSLSSGSSKEKTPLDLRVNSFIIRHGAIIYNQQDKPYTNGKINFYHIAVTGLSSHIAIKQITDNSIDIGIKKLSFRESSGLNLKHLSLDLYADKSKMLLKDFRVELPHSVVYSDSVIASYRLKNGTVDFNAARIKAVLNGKKLSLADFAFLQPKLKAINTDIDFSINARYDDRWIRIDRFAVNTAEGNMRLMANGSIKPSNKQTEWRITLKELSANTAAVDKINNTLGNMGIKIPKPLDKIRNILVSGSAYGHGKNVASKLNIHTNIGNASVMAKKSSNSVESEVNTPDLNVGELLDNRKFNKINAHISAKGKTIDGWKISALNIEGKIKNVDYNNYTFKDINIAGSYSGNNAAARVSLNDPNCMMVINGDFSNLKKSVETTLSASIENLNPKRINLSSKWGDAVFSAHLSAHTKGSSLGNLSGEIMLKNFQMVSPDKNYALDMLALDIKNDGLRLVSDFGNINLIGKYDFTSLGESIGSIVQKSIPTLPGIEHLKHKESTNRFHLTADISDTKWLETLLGIPFHTDSNVRIMADVNDESKNIFADINVPEFSYNGSKYHSGLLNISTTNDTVFANMNVRKILDNYNDILLNVKADAADNNLNSCIYVDYNTPTRIKGTLKAKTQFYKDFHGLNTMSVNIEPSQFSVKDTVWNVHSSNVTYNESKIQVNHFAIEHNEQYLKIDGMATKSPDDSICVDLKDINVKYILDLVNFHSVEFSGQASGKAYLKSVLNSPDAYAHISVDNFKFQDGNMGKLFANVNFDKLEKKINIDAHADEKNGAQTIITGYVSPAKNYIDLGITAKNTNIEFLQSFCGSFMSDIHAHANGFAQVYGDLSEINLRGKLIADGRLKISTLNTVYNLKNDTILMVPNEIIFRGDTVTDRNGNIAIVDGALHHKNLTRLTYDLRVKADHFLCYDFHDYGNNTFYGTVYGSGTCKIKGRPHEISFDIDMMPHANSFIEYNAASPDAIAEQNFIKWNKKIDTDSVGTAKSGIDEEEDLNDASDININFNVNVNPDFTLRVLMDKATGDKISLNGSGALKASYFNKGNFDMFGTYLIDHGLYSLTIQNIIKKDFKFQQGSSIVFGGNPFNANLNLKAVYPVNGVSLADLKIGNSFSSNNVRVDCIMNIGGTPESIRVDFDFDMPTVNNDAKQMVRSLINSEEEMNQQVVYLLAIGRFITDDKNNSSQENAQQSQTRLAMQSLLSGTISQQVNNILGSVVNLSNWNFGTNISTGTEGFNNAEYEGLLSGSLFSNRLLINGQFGYRDNPNTTTSFIGDFDVKYLLTPSGNMAIKVYNQTNDRYFTKSSLNTQGLGLIFKRDFNNWSDLWRKKKRSDVKDKKNNK